MTTLRIDDGTRTRTVEGRLASMIRRLIQHEAAIAGLEQGEVGLGFNGNRIYVRLTRTLEGTARGE